MSDKNKLTEDINHFEQGSAKDVELNQKLDEFMKLLESSEINSENIKAIKDRVNYALDQRINNMATVEKIKEVSLSDLDKMDQLDQLEILLNTNYLDSKQLKRHSFTERLNRMVSLAVGLLFITLGMAMIIMPAPPYFEMFTIFYFTTDDGVTLMDLISLIIIAIGTFIALRALPLIKSNE